jgi:hypothetical protein
LGAIKPNGLNRIVKVGYGHLWLREKNLSIIFLFEIVHDIFLPSKYGLCTYFTSNFIPPGPILMPHLSSGFMHFIMMKNPIKNASHTNVKMLRSDDS